MAGSTAIDAEHQVPPAGVNIDNTVTSDTSQNARLSTGGMTERLVSYSQKFMSSIGYVYWFHTTAFALQLIGGNLCMLLFLCVNIIGD